MLKSVLIANRAQTTLSLEERLAATCPPKREARRRKRRGEGRAAPTTLQCSRPSFSNPSFAREKGNGARRANCGNAARRV